MFSADAAGVNVLCARRWAGYRCGVIVGERVLDFGLMRGARGESETEEGERRGLPSGSPLAPRPSPLN